MSRVRLEGRSACAKSTRFGLIPFAFAVVMKSSCSVAIMSERRSRM